MDDGSPKEPAESVETSAHLRPTPSLQLPSPEVLRQIAAKQDARANEIRAARLARQTSSTSSRRLGKDGDGAREKSESDAAKLIQRNYRGYRDRRAMGGRGLDSSTRWMEALKEAKYANATRPKSRRELTSSSSPDGTARKPAKQKWKRVTAIAQRVGSDDTSESSENEDLNEEQRKIRARRKQEKDDRDQFAKTMGLEYFLEAVDQKHRYGSNLRRYHAEWKKSDTHENFFYWLDHGDGRNLDLEDRPRERLDREQVRYLSKEERQKYLTCIDDQGRFRLAKNDMLITTSAEYRDSMNGIVPISDETPTWREITTGEKPVPSPPSSSDESSSLSSIGRGKAVDDSKYTNTELHDAKGLDKLNHLSANSLMNHLLRKTTKKNTWIFVADTSFRMYIGIKQSGAFQHSSFLHGARVSAAGLIKIKRGQLRKLSPLSGHYAPPVKNFSMFVKSLKDAGADMSRCSISRSYAVILGLEGYLGVKKHVKSAEQGFKDVIDPKAKKEREEKEKDRSQSAETERLHLQKMEKQRRDSGRRATLARRFKGLRLDGVSDEEDDQQQQDAALAQNAASNARNDARVGEHEPVPLQRAEDAHDYGDASAALDSTDPPPEMPSATSVYQTEQATPV